MYGETVTKAYLKSFKIAQPASVMSASYKSNLNDLFWALGWWKLCHQRLEKETITTVYEALHGLTQEYLTSTFVFRNSLNAYHFRDTENKLGLPQPCSDYLKRSFSYSGAQLWKNFRLELRQATSLSDFKVKLSPHSF